MTREELKTATNDEFIDDIVSEIKKRMQESVLDKIRAQIDELDVLRFSSGERIYKDEVLDIIEKYKAEKEG